MIANTTRFGRIEIDESCILTLPNGLLGFSQWRLYALLDDEIGSPFKWLQSLENESLAFVTINPQIVVSNYSVALNEDHLKKLNAEKLEDLTVIVIVTMTKDIKDVTVNLQGPLVINFEKKVGMQVVIADGMFSTRHPLFGDRLHYIGENKNADQEEVRPLAAAG